jgi:ferredoxin
VRSIPKTNCRPTWAHYAEWNAYLAPRWQALDHNLVEKRPTSPPATDLSCADPARSEADILTWEDDVSAV